MHFKCWCKWHLGSISSTCLHAAFMHANVVALNFQFTNKTLPNFTRTLTNAQLLHSTLYALCHAPVKSDKSTGFKAPCRMLMQMTPDHSLFNWSSNSGNFGGKYYQLSEPNSHHLSHYKANTTREIWWRKKKNLRTSSLKINRQKWKVWLCCCYWCYPRVG